VSAAAHSSGATRQRQLVAYLWHSLLGAVDELSPLRAEIALLIRASCSDCRLPTPPSCLCLPAADGAVRARTRCRPSQGQLLQHERHREHDVSLRNDGLLQGRCVGEKPCPFSNRLVAIDQQRQYCALVTVFAGQLRQDRQMSCLSPSPLVASTSAVSNRPSGVLPAPPVCRFRHQSSFWSGTQLQQRCSRRRAGQSAVRFSKPTSALLEVSQDTWEAEVLQV